jgi:hypothetical protein
MFRRSGRRTETQGSDAVERALADADEAATDGRTLDAIGSLMAANRELHDPAIEHRLVQLRHLAFSDVDRGTRRPEWPAEFPECFDGSLAVPEVGPKEVTGALIGSAITRHGAIRVNGLVARPDVDRLVAGIERAFDGRDRWVDDKEITSPPWFVPFVPSDPALGATLFRSFALESSAVWAADSPRMLYELLSLYESVGLHGAAETYLGERPAISLRKCTLRRVPPDLGAAAWHQDGAFLGSEVRSLNVWLALSECGGDTPAPGLEFVPRRMGGVLETGTEGAVLPWAVSPVLVDEVVAQTGTEIVRPRFEAGDALLFDDRFLHRTGVAEHLSQPRYAIETWLFAPSTYPEDQIPLVF